MTGVDIKVRYGAWATVLRVKRVDVSDSITPEIDETDSESGGYGECEESGVIQADVTFEGWRRRAGDPPPKRGDLLENVLIAWDGNVAAPVVNHRHQFTKLKVLTAVNSGGVREGSQVWTLTCKTSGTYKVPGEA